MKKILLILLTLLIIGSLSIFIFIKASKTKVEFKSVPLYLNKEPTFKFTASSKHFAVETGIAYYNDDPKDKDEALIIKNFKLIKEIDNLYSYSFIIRFQESFLISNETHYQGKENIKDFLTDLEVGSVRPTDPFSLSKKEDFKQGLSITINYCLYNNKCYKEKLKIKYID